MTLIPSTTIRNLLFQERKGSLWFWRDYFGRRSLLVSQRNGGYLFSSVGDSKSDWLEVPSCGVFCLSNHELTCYPYVGQEELCLEFGKNLNVTVVISRGTYYDHKKNQVIFY